MCNYPNARGEGLRIIFCIPLSPRNTNIRVSGSAWTLNRECILLIGQVMATPRVHIQSFACKGLVVQVASPLHSVPQDNNIIRHMLPVNFPYSFPLDSAHYWGPTLDRASQTLSRECQDVPTSIHCPKP